MDYKQFLLAVERYVLAMTGHAPVKYDLVNLRLAYHDGIEPEEVAYAICLLNGRIDL